jgi:hypothetical protein
VCACTTVHLCVKLFVTAPLQQLRVGKGLDLNGMDEMDVTLKVDETFRSVLSGEGGSAYGWQCC